MLPPVRLHAYLKDLDRQFMFIAEAEASDLEIGHQAHKVVSQAGMLGLTRMSNCAANLENACRTGEGRDAAVLACRRAVGDIRQYAMPAAGAPAG
jgi:HPt (histidine-containing phosphotransfer) domain-containing protein